VNNKRKFCLICTVLVVLISTSQMANAATNVSLGKTYEYLITVPGEAQPDPRFYLDDPHAVHNSGLGAFSTGDLTDGAVQLCLDPDTGCNEMTASPSAVVGIWGASNATPPVEIIFDLGAVYLIGSITVGTAHRACCGSGIPDDVDISFSTTGTDSGDFSPSSNYNLWTIEPAGDAHHEITLAIPGISANYVKLSFDGGSVVVGENKYFLDEITIMDTDIVPPLPSTPIPTMSQWSLMLLTLLLGMVGFARLRFSSQP
jgi:hypothetical protein